MTPTTRRAALYSNGRTPLFLDTAEITFTFADGPPIIAQVQMARIDYARNTATIVFYESDREAIEGMSLGRHFHTTVSIGELQAPKRAEEANPDFKISHEMQLTLHALSGGKPGYDPYGQLEAVLAGCLKERRQMLRAEHSIRHEARATALTRLARLTDAQALSLLAGNRIAGCMAHFLSPPSAKFKAGVRIFLPPPT